jgi:hypothetical protein
MFETQRHPRHPAEKRRNRCFTLAMTSAELDELARVAASKGSKKGPIVREALRRHLAEIEKEDDDGDGRD